MSNLTQKQLEALQACAAIDSHVSEFVWMGIKFVRCVRWPMFYISEKPINGRYEFMQMNNLNKPCGQTPRPDGYLIVSWRYRVDGCRYTFSQRVHRLVAEQYIPNPRNLPEVNHVIPERKDWNVIENLEWCDSVYNNTAQGGKNGRKFTYISRDGFDMDHAEEIASINGHDVREFKLYCLNDQFYRDCGSVGYRLMEPNGRGQIKCACNGRQLTFAPSSYFRERDSR